ncbi:helix-turn-helix domain-containing protein [Adhaeribacter soli]|uniref:Helix-turn-helix transcriptional regulator n=1 Tax=Adhaeribacter soli TaxID=2607655 RepID=A0A5N1IMT3_9BACT|nr:helix-turn-helix transcriptional regulator [Adhaeribacter soli]KAA9331157.1 helix-turn-helix transcriptional regulator [Adhaeribacter soli]
MNGEEVTLKAIGRKLKELRIQKGYSSYEAFAVAHDLGRVQYWRLERGEANFTIRTLLNVLEIHNMTLKDFFSEGI